MSDLHERDHTCGIVDCIDHAIVTVTDSILIMSRELVAARGTSIVREALKTFRHTAKILLWESTQFPFGRFLHDQVHRSPSRLRSHRRCWKGRAGSFLRVSKASQSIASSRRASITAALTSSEME